MVVIRRDATLLAVTEHGLGKRSELGEYRVQRRGGRGIITLKRTDKTGRVVALKEVLPDDELMMISKHGIIIRLPVDGIRVIGRNTQGVKVMNLEAGDALIDVARVVKEEEGGEEDPTGDGGGGGCCVGGGGGGGPGARRADQRARPARLARLVRPSRSMN
jgi:DNA gyrase subunit A